MIQKPELLKGLAMALSLCLLSAAFAALLLAVPDVARGDAPFSDNELVNSDFGIEGQNLPSIAVDSGGDIYIAWEDHRSTTDWDIYFANSTDGGTTWSNPDVKINSDATSTDQNNPAIAVDPSGTLFAVWENDTAGEADIGFANSTDGGATWSSPNVKINTDGVISWPQSEPAIAVNSTDEVYVVWEDTRSQTDYDIFFSKSMDGGATWMDPNIMVNNDLVNATQFKPTIAVDHNGVIYVAWEDDRDGGSSVYFAKSTDGGSIWSPNKKVNNDPTTNSSSNPSIALDSTGNIYLAWQDLRSGNADIYYALSSDGGATWSDPNIKINSDVGTTIQRAPSIAVNSTGSIFVAWEDYRSTTDADIYFASSDDLGATWSFPNLRVNDDTSTTDQRAPSLTAGPDGSAYIAWQDYRFGGNYDIYFAYLMPPPPPPTIDRVIISLTPDASSGWIEDRFYFISNFETFYACGWNDTKSEFVSLVEADWSSNDTLVGTVNIGPATSTTFTAVGGGICNVSAFNATHGGNDTGVLSVSDLTVDRVIVSLSSDGSLGWIGDQTYIKHDIATFYACGWNDTSNVFVVLVDVTWGSSDPGVGDVTSPGQFSTFTAVDAGMCFVTATHASYGSNDTGILTVNPLEIDGIVISDSSDGSSGWIGDFGYKKYDTGTLYAFGVNDTHSEIVGPAIADWFSDDTGVGTVIFGPGDSTTFSAVDVGTCMVSATNGTYGLNWTGVLTVNPPDIDRIFISLTPDGSGGWIGDGTYTKYDIDTFFACGWNDTHNEFVALVDVDWQGSDPGVGTVVLGPGNSTTFDAVGAGQCMISAYNALWGTNWTGILAVNPLEIDLIEISQSPDGSGGWIGDRTYSVSESDTFYACGVNSTFAEFVMLVDADWVSDDPGVGTVNPGLGNYTMFTAMDAGTCRVSATSGTYGVNWTGVLTVSPMEVDSILISAASDGTSGWIGDQYYVLLDSDTLYACGWNDTANMFVKLVEADWFSDDAGVGVVNAGPGTETTFDTGGIGTCRVSATNATYGVNWTGVMTVTDYTIDRIIISLDPDSSSGWIGDRIYIKYDTDTYYACGWNDTSNVFVKLVDVNWVSDDTSVATVNAGPGTMTTLAAANIGTCRISATNATYGVNWTGILTVGPLAIDGILISLETDGAGGWIGEREYIGGSTEALYACGWNTTHDEFVSLIEAAWSSDDTDVGLVTSPGLWTNFSAQSVSVVTICRVTATYGIMSNQTGFLTVTAPTIDEIKIRTAEDGGGEIVEDRTYIINQEESFYAAAYNDTVGYIYDVEADWESSDATVGEVEAIILQGRFTALQVDTDSSCVVTATYQGISGSTGTLLVLAPRVDEIMIRHAAGRLGDIVTAGQYSGLDTDTFYAAAYNDTAGYLYDAEVTWSSNDSAVGQVTSPGIWTNFTAQNVGVNSSCTVTATYSAIISNTTGVLAVLASVDTTAPQAPQSLTLTVKGKDKIQLSWTANTEPDLAGYRIYRRTSPDDAWELAGSVDGSTTSFTNSGLKSGTKYYYSITAIDNASTPNESPNSQVASTTTESEEESWLPMILVIIVVIIIILVLVFVLRKKKPAEEIPPAEESSHLEDEETEVEEPLEEEPEIEEDSGDYEEAVEGEEPGNADSDEVEEVE